MERASLPVITPCVHSKVWATQRCSRSYTEKRRGRKEAEVARRIKQGESKGEKQIQPVICSLSVLHCLGHRKRFTEYSREEMADGGDRGDLVEIKESPKKERAVKPVISLLSKNGY